MAYLNEARERYLDYYRRVLREKRGKGFACTPELWIRPNKDRAAAGGGEDDDAAPADPLCFDIISGDDAAGDKRELHAVMMSTEVPTGRRIDTIRAGEADRAIDVRIYPIAWEMCIVWFVHPIGPPPVLAAIEPWKRKWMDPERGADPADEDRLCGCVHFLGAPSAEGGGHFFEADFGSAPLSALTALLNVLAAAGVTEIELGRTDGSDLPPDVVAELQRTDVSPPRLTEIVASLLRELPEVRSADVIGPQEIALVARRGEKSEQKVFTANLYLRLQRVGAEGRVVDVWRFVRGQRETLADSGEVSDLAQLRPLIKDDRFLAQFKEMMKQDKLSMLARRLVADLWVCCVWDLPHGMRFASADDPAKYGMTAQQFHERAVANYVREHPPAEFAEHGPLRVARTSDSYDASLLLDDAFWREIAGESKNVRGELLVCVPARDIVLITGSATLGGARALREVARKVEVGGDHLITQTILVRRGEAWEKWTPHAAGAVAKKSCPRPAAPSAAQTPPAPARKPWWKFW